MTKLEQMELDVLEYIQLPSMPDIATDETPMWIYAVAKIRTFSLSCGYAIVMYSYGEQPKVVKVFCEGGIASIEELRPYKFFDKKYLPDFDKANSAKAFVCKAYGVSKEDVANLSKDELLRLIYSYCIKRQLGEEEEEKKRKQADLAKKAAAAEIEKIKEQQYEQEQ